MERSDRRTDHIGTDVACRFRYRVVACGNPHRSGRTMRAVIHECKASDFLDHSDRPNLPRSFHRGGHLVRRQRKSVKFLAVLAGVSLVAAACGGDDDDGADDTPTTAETGGAETEDTATDTGGEDTATDTGGEDTATDTGGEDTATDTGDTGGDTGATEYTGEPGEVGGSGCGMPHGPYEDKDAASGEV